MCRTARARTPWIPSSLQARRARLANVQQLQNEREKAKATARGGTNAFGEVGAGEEPVAGEAVEVGLHLHPRVAALVGADEAEPPQRLVRAGARTVELREMPARGARGEGGLDAGLRLLLLAPFGAGVGAAETLGEVLRELARNGHGLRLELLRELKQQVRRGPPDRRGLRPRRGRRRARGRLDAAQHNGVVVLQVERDLDELLAVVGAPQRGARAERARRRPRRPAPSLRVGGGGRGGAAPH
jgi:hypothetical protein